MDLEIMKQDKENKVFEIPCKNRNNEDVVMSFVECKSGASDYGCGKSIQLYIDGKWYDGFDVRYSYISDFKGDLEYFAYWYITTKWYGFKGDYVCDRYEVVTCYRNNRTKDLDLDSINAYKIFTSEEEAIEYANSFKDCLDADDSCDFSEVVVIYKIDKNKWDYKHRVAVDKSILKIIDSNEL